MLFRIFGALGAFVVLALASPDGWGHSPASAPFGFGAALGAPANGAASAGSTDPAPSGEGAPQGQDSGAIKLTAAQITASGIATAPVGAGALFLRLTAPGTIMLDADRVARAPARVAGTVAQLRKRLGDSVVEGEVVAILDSREVADAKSDFLTASVALDLERALFERAKLGKEEKLLAEQQFFQVQAKFLEAQLRLDLSRQKLSALNLDAAEVAKAAKQDAAKPGPSSLREFPIRAPISGRVVERKVDVGTAVGGQGDPPEVYVIADLSKVWVELSIATADLEAIKEGQRVTILKGGAKDQGEAGRIMFISPILNPETRMARVIAEIDNKALSLRPGYFVTALILLKEEQVDLRVPRSALQTIVGPVVFVRTPEGFQMRNVKTGRQDDQAVEVIEGLSANEQIAVKNTFLLKAELGKTGAGDE